MELQVIFWLRTAIVLAVAAILFEQKPFPNLYNTFVRSPPELLLGLDVVAEAPNPVVDIVAIHGLNGHRDQTWTARNGVHWLRDLLPHDIPNARILSWGYDANTHSSDRISCNYLWNHGQALVHDLRLEREHTNSTRRPIIFVAHSLGGIVLKSALIWSDAARRGALGGQRSIRLSTYGILFMGTPHQGSDAARLGELLVNIGSIAIPTQSHLLTHLDRDSEWLQQQLDQYGPIGGDFVTKFVFEEYKTPIIGGRSKIIVPRSSAVTPGMADAEAIGIHEDHRNIVRFTSSSDYGYKTISRHLHSLVHNAPTVIKERWDVKDEADLKSRGSFSVNFGLPEVYDLEQFIGRKQELIEIHQLLENNGSRKTVTLHGLGGIGKTQLAIAYAKTHRTYYSATFWFNCKDRESIKQGFVNAARRIHRDHPSLSRLNMAIESQDIEKVVDVVKLWLEVVGNTNWLLIFDNYDSPALPTIQDPNAIALQPFLPEAYQGAVLITTRLSQLQIGHQIHVRKLADMEESLAILSCTSGRQNLTLGASHTRILSFIQLIVEIDSHARALAKKLDGLPLALASAGAFLRQITLTFTEYLHLWDESWNRLQYATPALLTYEDRTLWSTWGISLEHVKLQDDLAGKLLQYWAYFDNEDLWFELLKIDKSVRIPAEALWIEELTQDKLRFEMAIKALCDYGIVETSRSSGTTNTGSHGYSIHSCVHSWVTHFENTGARNAIPAMRQAAFCSIGLFIREKPRDHSLTRRLLPHFRRRLRFLKNDLEQANESERSELEYSIKTFSEFLLDTIRRLALDYRCQGGITEAEKLLNNGLELYSTSLFFESSTVGCELFLSIGFLYSTQSYDNYSSPHYAIAEKNFQKALQCDETYPFMTADHLTEIAIFYESQLQLYSKAKEIHEKAIGILTSDKGIDHSAKIVQKLFFLGRNYLHSVDYPNAKFTLKAALAMCVKAFGPGHKKCKDMALWVEAIEAQQHLPVLFLLFCKDKYELDCRLNSIPSPYILGWNHQPMIIRF